MTTWVMATVLKALADQGIAKAGASFFAHDLQAWLGDTLVGRQRTNCTSRLLSLDFLKHVPMVHKELGRVEKYVLTDAGAAAVAEAAQGKVRKSGPKVGGRNCPIPERGSLVWKLWDLLRMRKALESDTAAELLCDAGGDNARVQEAIGRCLRQWARRGVVTEAKRRVRIGANRSSIRGGSQGLKRYVLNDEYKAVLVPPARYQRVGQKGSNE